jgi:hypothetical protein
VGCVVQNGAHKSRENCGRAVEDLELVTHRRPKVFPHRAQPHEKGFSLVWVLSCL